MLSIPRSRSDQYLADRGLDLVDEYERIVRAAIPLDGRRVLEVATGSGRMTAVLAHLGFTVWTADITHERRSDALRRVTEAWAHRVQWMQCDLERLPFRTGSFDTIVCLNTLHELSRPQRCLGELFRVQRPGGMIVVGDFQEEGFAVMDDMERTLRGQDHPRGRMGREALLSDLKRHYRSISTIVTSLNATFVASR